MTRPLDDKMLFSQTLIDMQRGARFGSRGWQQAHSHAAWRLSFSTTLIPLLRGARFVLSGPVWSVWVGIWLVWSLCLSVWSGLYAVCLDAYLSGGCLSECCLSGCCLSGCCLDDDKKA